MALQEHGDADFGGSAVVRMRGLWDLEKEEEEGKGHAGFSFSW